MRNISDCALVADQVVFVLQVLVQDVVQASQLGLVARYGIINVVRCVAHEVVRLTLP